MLWSLLVSVIVFNSAADGVEEDCWWTGCQPKNWGVRGCDQYQRVEGGRRPCEGGDEFNCCAGQSATITTTLATTTATSESSCWWTGCQPTSWGVRGCGQYDRDEAGRRTCKDGHEFNCCPKKPKTTTEAPCWWSGCQKNDWAVRGCQQYGRVDAATRPCDNGLEYKCCVPGSQGEGPKEGEEIEECWWSSCIAGNSSSFLCPTTMKQKGSGMDCGNGDMMFECCGKRKISKKNENQNSITGESFEDFVKYLFMKQDNFVLKPDSLKCELVDPGKKHIVRIKNEGIRICDLCPNLPQKRLSNVYLDRVPTVKQSNLRFPECFALCYEEKTCMAVSHDAETSTCYLFDSTAGGYGDGPGWTTVLMTQPSGVIHDWSYTRHTRILGYLTATSIQPNFLNCLNDCNVKPNCNYASYFATTRNCSMFSKDDDVVYVDMAYGHISATRVSHTAQSQPLDERFVPEGEELSLGKSNGNVDGKCKHLKNGTHGGFYSQSCLVSGSALVGCDQASGCKLCYYPEKASDFEKLPICPDSEFERLGSIKQRILSKMDSCFADASCIGIGYNSKNEEISPMTMLDYIRRTYTTKYMLRIPPTDSRKFLRNNDLIAQAEIKAFTGEFQELKNQQFIQCIDAFSSKRQFSVMSYSYNTKVCKMGSEGAAFSRNIVSDSVAVFKKSPLLSAALNYLRTPGFAVEGKPRATNENCRENCEQVCTRQCSLQFKEWCVYLHIQRKRNGADCYFYDDDSDFKLKANENGMIYTQISSMDFTLQSFDKLDSFQTMDVYTCFDDGNQQTQTSLTTYPEKEKSTKVGKFRGRRGLGSFLKNLGKTVVDGFKAAGNAIVDTGKGVVDTVKNLAKGDLKKAGESFMKIPIVDMAKDTVELGGAVITGDWDKAKEKGKEILESDAFELVTTVALPGAGKIITTGAKAGLKTIAQAGKKGAKDIVKGGTKKVDDVAKDSKKVHNDKSEKKKPDDKKKDERIEKERGEKCEQEKRTKRQANKRKAGPGNGNACKKQQKTDKKKCDKPKVKYVITSTLNDCINQNVGDTCSFECKPGYHEEKPTVRCAKVRNDVLWEPRPKCTLEDCPAGNKPVIVLESPQTKSLGVPALGDYITAYVILYDKNRKLPVWSVALHQSDQFESKNYNSAKEVKRNNGFTVYPCTQLKKSQASNADYKGRGWHKGHLTPANVARWSEKSKRLSNLYINAAPQDGPTNSGPWNLLEAHVYCFSKRYRSVVATGICSASIGSMAKIDVPKCYWKMVCYRDEQSNHQVAAFYSSNSHVNTKKEKDDRADEVFTPLSQAELRAKLGESFQEVWVRPARHINVGRPVPVGSAVWMPVNVLSCRDAMALPKDEKDAWKAAFDASKHELKRGKNTKEDGDDDDDDDDSDDDDRRRRRRQAKSNLDRGCHKDEMKDALDASGFFLPYKETEDVSENDDDENGVNDEGDGSVKVSVQSCGKRIIGYYTSWGEKTIAGRELQRLTHVIYAFLEMHSDGSISVGSADRKNAVDVDEETRKARKRLENLMSSAQRYPHLKVMFAVGGWENSQYFSAVAASPDRRVKFIAAIIRMIQEYGFDGVDIDWEYPVTGGADEGVPADKQNYVTLMKELRTALDGLANEAGRKEKFLISFAGAAGQWTLDPGYDLPGLLTYADFANIMTYDYFGAWSSKWGAYTGPPSPLFFGMPPGFSGKTNADWSVKYYTCKTQWPHKINMGVPFYGRYWKNVGASVDGKDEMWRKAEAVNGKFEGGYVPWYKMKKDYLNNGAFQKKFHEKAKAPYAWNPAEKIFLGYENKESLEHKVKYAVDKNVGGLMIWALELDDDSLTLLDTIAKAPLCQKTDPKDVNHKCSPIDDKRWWTPEDGDDKAGLCGRSAPLYKGFYPVCDPDDPGYSCCGVAGYCGTGPKYCDCPTCKNYRDDPKTILKEPIKPSIPVTWYLLNDPDGKRGRCGRKIPKIGSVYPTCNPDDENSFCCSNGGYCGNTDAHCKCNGCIDFKKNPKYQYGPKKWWTLEDGEDLGGQCGPKAPKVDGKYEAECEGNSKFHCCSPTGWCGSGPDFCNCKGCKDFRGKN